jgi:hypothetical protein
MGGLLVDTSSRRIALQQKKPYARPFRQGPDRKEPTTGNARTRSICSEEALQARGRVARRLSDAEVPGC